MGGGATWANEMHLLDAFARCVNIYEVQYWSGIVSF